MQVRIRIARIRHGGFLVGRLLVEPAGAIGSLAMPTPIIEPIKACARWLRSARRKSSRSRRRCPNLEDELDRQQRDDAVGHGPGGNDHAQKVEEARPYRAASGGRLCGCR